MPTQKKFKLYIGCAITEAPVKFASDVKGFKRSLANAGYEILDFIDLAKEATPAEVYKWDIDHCIKECDAFIAICDHPSTGMGFELGEAARLIKPVLLLAQKDVRVTRLVRGAAEVLDSFSMESYETLDQKTLILVIGWLRQQRLTS